jgi:hypothetical protein
VIHLVRDHAADRSSRAVTAATAARRPLVPR